MGEKAILNAKITRLEKEIREKDSEIINLKVQIGQLEKKNDQLNKRVEHIAKSMDNSPKELQRDETVSLRSSTTDSTNNSISTDSHDIDVDWKTSADTYRQYFKDVEKRLKIAVKEKWLVEKDHVKYQEAYREERTKAQNFEAQLNTLSAEYQGVVKELATQRRENQSLKQNIEDIIAKKDAEFASAVKALGEKSNEYKVLKEYAVEVAAKNDDLNREKESLNHQNYSLRQYINDVAEKNGEFEQLTWYRQSYEDILKDVSEVFTKAFQCLTNDQRNEGAAELARAFDFEGKDDYAPAARAFNYMMSNSFPTSFSAFEELMKSATNGDEFVYEDSVIQLIWNGVILESLKAKLMREQQSRRIKVPLVKRHNLGNVYSEESWHPWTSEHSNVNETTMVQENQPPKGILKKHGQTQMPNGQQPIHNGQPPVTNEEKPIPCTYVIDLSDG